MRFRECQAAYHKFHAYADWMTVADAKASGDIPEAYHQIFDDNCECGSENIIAMNLRREMCCDPKCPIKQSYKIAEMFSRYGYLGLGYAKCNKIYGELLQEDKRLKQAGCDGLFRTNSYTEVLTVPFDKYPDSAKETMTGEEFFHACQVVRQTPVTFAKLVSNLGLQDFGSNSDKLLDGIDSFNQLLDTISECGGVQNFCVRHSVYSPEMIFNFSNALEDIAIASVSCKGAIKASAIYKMSVCITGNVVCNGQSMTKDKYITMCNELCIDKDGIPMFELKNVSGPAKVPFVLYTTAGGTAKFLTGKSRGTIIDEFGEHPVLMTVSQFYNWLKGAIEIWNSMENRQLRDWTKALKQSMQSQMGVIQSF